MPKVRWSTGVYCWRNKTNGKVYVGGAYESFAGRRKDYLQRFARGACHNDYLQKAWDSVGEEGFEWVILERCHKSKVSERETAWIARYNATDSRYGYNICETGCSRLGVKHREESKAKMSATKKALYQTRSGPRTGAVLSEETRKKIGQAHRGRKASPEARAKMSAARTGMVKTPETCAKLKANHWSKGPRAKEIAESIATANVGGTKSSETRKKISETKLRRRAEKKAAHQQERLRLLKEQKAQREQES